MFYNLVPSAASQSVHVVAAYLFCLYSQVPLLSGYLFIILSPHLSSCLIIPEHVSVLLFRITPCLMSHVIRLPIGYFGFSLPSNLPASSPIISPNSCVYKTNLLIITNELGFHTNTLTH